MTSQSKALVDFVPHTSLEDVSFLELSARRYDDSENPSGGAEPQYRLRAQVNREPLSFRLILRVEIEETVGSVHVEAAAAYTVNDFDRDALTPRLAVEYANEVGVMALLPYLRHAIADLTLRVFGTPLLMPVFDRGAVRFPLPKEQGLTDA